jgi:hypothetical protein
MIITKESIENELGFEINNFKIEPMYENDQCVGLNIFVEKKTTVCVIENTIQILKI